MFKSASRLPAWILAWSSLFVGYVSLAGGAAAQNARVATVDAVEQLVRDIDFSQLRGTVLNTDAGTRVRLQSAVFRADGAAGVHLVVADDLGGQVLFYDQAVGNGQVILDATNAGHPRTPDGLSLDAAQNLYGVTVAGGEASGSLASVWVLLREAGCPGLGAGCLPGGYVDGVGTLDTLAVEADELAQTLVVTAPAGSLVPGDLLLLSSSPAVLWRYHAADVQAFLAQLAGGGSPAEIDPEVFIHTPGASVPPAMKFPAGATPGGLAITPDGGILISSREGVVFHFNPDGTRLSAGGNFVDFASGLGQGRFKIASGHQDGEPRAFLADQSGGRVMRFTVEADGTGTLDATVSAPPAPFGIAATTSSLTTTPTGSGVTVATSNLMASRIENVTSAGSTNITEFIFTDPREAEMSTPAHLPLHRSLYLDEISALLPAGVEIPPYVRSMRKGDPLSGTPTFILLLADTTAEILGVVQHVSDESLVLGYAPSCDRSDRGSRPRMFWVPTPDEPGIPEGSLFINVSNGCGSTELFPEDGQFSRGMTRSYSLFLVGARDVRPDTSIGQFQLSGLQQVLSGATCVTPSVHAELEAYLNAAVAEFGLGLYPDAYASLDLFLAIAEGAPGAFVGCASNEGGDLRARARSALFTISGLL